MESTPWGVCGGGVAAGLATGRKHLVLVVFHQKLTRTCPVPHQSLALGLTRRAVTLEESMGQHPKTQTT